MATTKQRKHKKKKFATGDCETDPFMVGRLPKPFIWGFYDGKEYFSTTSIESYVDHIKNFNGYIYFHNGGKFDFHYLLHHIAPDTTLRIINGRLGEFKLGKATLRDSFLLLHSPLSAFSKQEFDYHKLEEQCRSDNMEEIEEYLKSDCVNLYNFLDAFFKEYPCKLTIASAALDIWQREMKGRIDETNKSYYDLFYPFYYGGRCEVFRPGIFHTPINVYDINSAYPYAMIHNHPAGKEYIISRKILPEHLEKSFVHCVAESHGALPLRKKDGGVHFPHGEQEFFVTGWEIKAGLETGTLKIKKVIRCIIFKETVNYVNYVNHFYALKKRMKEEKDKARELFAKYFLNSLYGKMAANPENYGEYKLIEFGTKPPDGWIYDIHLGELQLITRPVPESISKYYNVATAASITGFVRAYLWRTIKKCGDVFYCDTDSMFTSKTVPTSKELGGWSHEFTGNSSGFAGKKLYAIIGPNGEEKKASKGARLTTDEIFLVANGGTVFYNPSVPTYSIKNGIGFIGRKIRSTIEDI